MFAVCCKLKVFKGIKKTAIVAIASTVALAISGLANLANDFNVLMCSIDNLKRLIL